MANKNVLILGATGQDGSYLSKLLVNKGYNVYGSTRDVCSANLDNFKKLGIDKEINLISTTINDFRSLILTLEKVKPDMIFHLAGQTSVGLSFELPFESLNSIAISTLNLLETVRFFDTNIKLFIPCSSDCFGELSIDNPANENTLHNPRSPYAISKSASYWLAKSYRESYGMFISVGFLSNHESPLRGKHFVTSKILKEIKLIKNKKISKLYLGNLDIIRDWGWAPSYVEAIYRIMMYDSPDDFIVSTGKSFSLNYMIEKLFEISGLGDYQNFIRLNNSQIRPNEIRACYLNPSKIEKLLNWKQEIDFESMIHKLVKEELY